MVNRLELYKAVKWEAQEYHACHGFTLVDLWKVIKADELVNKEFWKVMALQDYYNDHAVHTWTKLESIIVSRKLQKRFPGAKGAVIFTKYLKSRGEA